MGKLLAKTKLVCLFEIIFVLMYTSAEETCESIPTEVHITKEEYDELGRFVRSCSGDVNVNKCEGMCNSQVQPSVVTPTGFLKDRMCLRWLAKVVPESILIHKCHPFHSVSFYVMECFCCRENYLRERLVTLTHCYDPDGLRLEEEDMAIMEVRLREPAECKCYKCGDYSR